MKSQAKNTQTKHTIEAADAMPWSERIGVASARESISDSLKPVQLLTREVRAKTQELGQSFLRKLRENHLERGVRRVPARMRMSANQLELVIELIDDFRSGAYRNVSWSAIAIMTGALLYSVSPADVLPDALMGLGHLDDAIVLSIAMRLVRGELRKYTEFKGYSFEKYFPQEQDKSAHPEPQQGTTQAA
jgi:uncharacterized membrane protein YkvA (DUF1232 family)